jgi:hypothetical protein
VLRCLGYRSALAAGQVRRRRFIFQQRVEHGVWSSGDGKHSFEDNDWRRGRLYAFCIDAFTSRRNGFPLGFAIDCAGSDSYTSAGCFSGSDRSASGFACCFANRLASRFARWHEVVVARAYARESQANSLRYTCYLTTQAEVAELADAHV